MSTRRCTNGTTSDSCWPSRCTNTTNARSPTRSRTSFANGICSSARCSRRSAGRAAGAVDRRGRSRRRGIRGVSARGAFGFPDDDSGTRHHARRSRPLVVITSNGTRELSDALRRRCLYQYIDYPDFREGARDRRDGHRKPRGSLPASSSSSCRASAAWTCRRGRASPRRSIGRRRCCGWAFPRSTMRGGADPRNAQRADQDPRRPRRLQP